MTRWKREDRAVTLGRWKIKRPKDERHPLRDWDEGRRKDRWKREAKTKDEQ
jgi:hypothetical protein